MAQIARPEADKAAGQAEKVVHGGFQSARQAVDAAAEAERRAAHRAGGGVAEINQSLVELLNQQAKHNVQVFQALAQPANWGKAAQLQEAARTLQRLTFEGQPLTA